MTRLLKPFLFVAAIIAMFAAAPAARADVIGLGGNLAGPSNTTFQGGTLLASNSVAVMTATFSGTARSAVYQNAAGTLDFYYQFTNNGPDDIGRLSFFNYDNFTTDVFNVTNGAAIGAGFLNGTVDSTTVDRGASATFNSVGYNYAAGAFLPGTTSLALLIRTNATAFMPGTFSIINGSTSTTPSFAPSAAIPEPATMILLGTGLAGLAGAARRRMKNKE